MAGRPPVWCFLCGLASLLAVLLPSACERPSSSPPGPSPDAVVEAPAPEDPVRSPPSEVDASPERALEPEPAIDDGPLSPLPSEVAAKLAAIRSDPPPAHLVRDTHYWISNEQSHFLWHEAVQGRGGALVGVATDQNYLLAGWARSELLVLMDFDGGVVDLHRVYGAMFRRAGSPAELRAMWSEDQYAVVQGWLSEDLPAEQAQAATEALVSARPLVADRLAAVDQQYRALGIATFLSDDEQFRHLRSLWRTGRVVTVRGDLTADMTMVDVAAALRAADLEIGVLYLSNAEQYFRYKASFRDNIEAQPMAADGVVLRTHGWIQFGYVADEDYHYNRQPAPLFVEWMKRGRAWGVPAMLEHRSKTGVRGSSILDRPPPRRGRARPE